jgi:hypothetical protein
MAVTSSRGDTEITDSSTTPTAVIPEAFPAAGGPSREVARTGRFSGAWWADIARRHWPAAAGVAIFTVLAIVVTGSGAPWSSTSMPVCACGDGAQEVWFLAWPAYALSHGLNPFTTNFVAYPHGLNLMSSTSMPFLGVLMSPVTLAAGPVVTFNLLVRLALISSATSMFLVLRRYVGWWPFALAGGLLYGFSPYMLGEGYTHVFLVFVPIPPILFMLFEDLLVGHKWKPAKVGVWIGVLSAVQFLISSETLAIIAIMVAAAIVVLAVRHPIAARQAVPAALRGAGAAAASFVVLAGLPIYYYLFGPQHVSGPQHPKLTYVLFHDDLYGTVLPTSYQLFGPHSLINRGNFLLQGNGVDHVTYLGLPLVALSIYIAVRCRHNGMVALSGLLALGSMLLTLGPRLFFNNHEYFASVSLPYSVLLHVPLLDGLLAPRFILAEFFFLAILLALGLDQMRTEGLFRGRDSDASSRDLTVRSIVCSGLAVVALLPLVPRDTYQSAPVPVAPFFSNSKLLAQIPAGGVVLPYPQAQLPTVVGPAFPDLRTMLWVAVSGFHFRIIGAYAAQPYAGGLGQGNELLDAPTDVQQLFGWAQYGSSVVARIPINAGTLADLRNFCATYDVSAIIIDPTAGVNPSAAVRYVSEALRSPPRHEAGVDVWFGAASLARAASK